MNILVTGGAGYIGSHVCKALHLAGHSPVTYDNLSRGHRWAVKWGPLEQGDVRNREALDRVIARHRPAALMHFAALTYVGESVANPGLYYGNNVCGSLTLLEAMRDHGIDRIVFSSTAAVYGMPEAVPITEDEPLKPINPYGASKLAVETMLRDFDAAHGIRHVALRYFNAAGADPEGEIGEVHDPETHLIPLVLDAAAGRRPAIEIFGEDYDTPDGTCIRDYIHVTDLAEAHLLALRHLNAGAPSAAFNLGNGSGYSVKQIIDTARAVTGADIAANPGPRRAGDPARLVASNRSAAGTLEWRPALFEIERIVQTAWAWHRSYFDTAPGKEPS